VKVESSFSRLFRQSRYARGLEDENSLTKQNRRELFAVAAVSFVAKHEPVFARELLARVAGVPRQDLAHSFKIKPQAHACADLLIIDEVNRRHYVVEFKVHAPTDKKQSPGAKAFAGARGYCSQMKQRFGDVTGQNLTYTLLAKNAEFDDKLVDGVACRARTWKELIPANGKDTVLVADLLDSLGEFGIPVLQLRNVRSMKNSRDAEGAFKIHQLLQSILTDFRSSALDIGSDETYRWWCGMNLTARKGQHPRLRRWLGHDWSYIGWIGYLFTRTTGKPELSVWLFFEPKHSRQREETIQLLRRKLPGKTVKPYETENDLIVLEAAERIRDEKEWFRKTLQNVLENAVPTSVRDKPHKDL
jgi:hypothetical protein